MGKAGVEAGKDRGENIMGHESIPQCCTFRFAFSITMTPIVLSQMVNSRCTTTLTVISIRRVGFQL